jgi:hypothetical protein
MIAACSTTEKDWWVSDMQINGGLRTQQTSLSGILADYTGGSGDKRIRLWNLFIFNMSTDRVKISRSAWSNFIPDLWIQPSDGVGPWMDAGVSDCIISGVQVGQSGHQGIRDIGASMRYVGCKAFQSSTWEFDGSFGLAGRLASGSASCSGPVIRDLVIMLATRSASNAPGRGRRLPRRVRHAQRAPGRRSATNMS